MQIGSDAYSDRWVYQSIDGEKMKHTYIYIAKDLNMLR